MVETTINTTPLLEGAGSLSSDEEPHHEQQQQQQVEEPLRFYDAASMLQLDEQLAHGYMILLSGRASESCSFHCNPTDGNKDKDSSIDPMKGDRVSATTEKVSAKPAATVMDPESMEAVDPSAISLAFASLVDGHVLDACFGVGSREDKDPSPAQTTKEQEQQTQHRRKLQRQHVSSSSLSTSMSTYKDKKGTEAIRREVIEIKNILGDVAFLNDDIPPLAVDTYVRAFAIIIRFHQDVNGLMFWLRCFRYSKLQKNAKEALKANFERLATAVSAIREEEDM